MTFSTSVPQNSDKIRNFPAAMQTNQWPRLVANIAADHVFQNTAGVTAPYGVDISGYHQAIHCIQQSVVPTTGAQISSIFYFNGEWFIRYPSNGTFVQITSATLPGGNFANVPIRAAVQFNGQNGVINYQYNVSSVTRSSTGVYRVNFTSALPSVNYVVQCTGNRTNGSSSGYSVFCPDTGSSSFNVAYVDLLSFGSTTTPEDVRIGSVLILGG